VSVLHGSASSTVRSCGLFDGKAWPIAGVAVLRRRKGQTSLLRAASSGAGVSAISPLIRLRFRAAARLPFVCLSKRKEAKEKTPDTTPAAPCRTRRGAGLSRRSRDATAGVRHEPEAATHTVRPAEGRIPQRRCGKALLRLSGRYSDARGNGMRPELGRLWPSSDSWTYRRSAPDTRRHCASPSPCNGTEYRLGLPKRRLYWAP